MQETFKKIAFQAAFASSKILLQNFGKVKSFSSKSNALDLVTNVDLQSNDAIISSIKRNFPDHGIVSEESPVVNSDAEYSWFIDPLDGTLNYSRRFPFYSCSIALARKGEVVLGVVALPFSNEILAAEKGKGCFLNGEKARVSKETFSNGCMDVSGIAFQEFDCRFPSAVFSHGSTVSSLAFVAAGRFILKTVSPRRGVWDFAAGALLVEEAGGKVTDWTGKKWSLESKGLLASNGACHEEAIKILMKHG